MQQNSTSDNIKLIVPGIQSRTVRHMKQQDNIAQKQEKIYIRNTKMRVTMVIEEKDIKADITNTLYMLNKLEKWA